MGKLRETMWGDKMGDMMGDMMGDIPGWQWEDGPIFIGVDGRRLAIEYGKAVQRLEDLDGLANLCQQQVMKLARLKKLD